MTSKDGSSLLIVAAEASSALYGQRLLEIFKEQSEDIECFGIGSRAMEELGFQCLGRSEELAVVGLVEVLKHFGQIRETFNGILERCEKNPPKCALLLDYPDFNLRLAKKLKKNGNTRRLFYFPSALGVENGSNQRDSKKHCQDAGTLSI